MWRLSDTLVEEFTKTLEESMNAIKKAVESLKGEKEFWREMPEPVKCRGYGVDGSRGAERRSGVVAYAVSGVAVGEDILEMHDVAAMKTYKHVNERIRLHMALMELRAGAMVDDAEIVLMDGTLSGTVIRPPAYVTDNRTYPMVASLYDFDNLVDDFVEVLDNHWWVEIERDVRKGITQRPSLLSRSPYFDKFEEGYRTGKKDDKDNLRVLLEYVEYLHAFNKLFDKDWTVVSVAKTFYTNEFVDIPGLMDAPVLEMLAYDQFEEERAAYVFFNYRKIDKRIPRLAQRFNNVKTLLDRLRAAYARFTDFGNIYLLESNYRIDDDLMSKLMSLEADGYILPLIYAHKHAEIKKRELKKNISALLDAAISSNPEYRLLLKYGRSPLEG